MKTLIEDHYASLVDYELTKYKVAKTVDYLVKYLDKLYRANLKKINYESNN